MSEQRTVGVLGAGPVGTILATGLIRAGIQVVVAEAAQPRREQLLRDGLRTVGVKEWSAQPAAVVDSLPALAEQELDALFLCIKTWSLRTLLPVLRKHLAGAPLLVSFQNGIGPEEEVAAFFGPARVARGVVNYAGGMDEDGAARMVWFNPPNYLGPLDEASAPLLRELAGALSGSGLQTHPVSTHEMKKMVFYKTVLNAALSPVCASMGITMQKAMSYPHTRALARAVIREGLAVGAHLGYHYGEDALDRSLAYLDKGGDHMPSMWVDLQNETPTEIEYISGKLVQLGLMFKGLDVSANTYLSVAIVNEEIKRGTRKPAEVPEYLRAF